MNITEYDLHGTTEKVTGRKAQEEIRPFFSSLEYIGEELKRLDLKLMLYLQQCLEKGTINSSIMAGSSAENIFALLNSFQVDSHDRQQIEQLLKNLDGNIESRLAVGAQKGMHISLQHIANLFGLGPFEQECAIACLAPEINQKYQHIYGFLQNDLTEIKPNIDMLAKIFLPAGQEASLIRSVFDAQAPLVEYLLERRYDLSDSWTPLIARHIKLDDWIVNYLLDIEVLDSQLVPVAEFIPPEEKFNEGAHSDLTERIVNFVGYYHNTGRSKLNKLFYFYGPDGVGKTGQVLKICNEMNLPLLMADVEKMLSGEAFEETLRRLGRQARLCNAALCLKNAHLLVMEAGLQNKLNALLEMLQSHVPLTFMLGRFQWKPAKINNKFTYMDVGFPHPTAAERRAHWEHLGMQYSLAEDVNLDKVSENFRFTRGQIETALRLSEGSSVWKGAGNGQIAAEDLYNSCYAQSNRKLGTLASKIKPVYTMQMLVLPEEQMQQMQEICNQVKYRSLVYEKWGFEKRLSLGKGLNILFSGPPGSGKTMAAEVISSEIGLEIYKIDVSQVVSKYIGETEKNLEHIFSEAETSNAILFFDEADALFGKRSEVKDAHDRYANVEIGYLLQRMEEYTGIVILATNLNQNIDEAFLRRLHFNVPFPFPDKEQRKKIWQGIFPAGAPVDAALDYDFLAEKFVLAGGNIKNIAVNAAFYAAHAICPISIKEIMLAAKREYKKLGKTFLMSDYAPYYQLIEVKK